MNCNQGCKYYKKSKSKKYSFYCSKHKRPLYGDNLDGCNDFNDGFNWNRTIQKMNEER